jgi:hypothetical protein
MDTATLNLLHPLLKKHVILSIANGHYVAGRLDRIDGDLLYVLPDPQGVPAEQNTPCVVRWQYVITVRQTPEVLLQPHLPPAQQGSN